MQSGGNGFVFWGRLCAGEAAALSFGAEQGAMGKLRHGAGGGLIAPLEEGASAPRFHSGGLFGVCCSPALVCDALVALRAELPQPVRGWRGSGGDALGTGGGLCGESPPLSKPFFPRWVLFPAGRHWGRAGWSLPLVQVRSVCTISLADAEQAQLRSGAGGTGSSWR